MLLFTVISTLAVGVFGNGIGIASPIGLGLGANVLSNHILVGNDIGLGHSQGVVINHGVSLGGWGGKSAVMAPVLGVNTLGINRGILVGSAHGLGGIGLAGKGIGNGWIDARPIVTGYGLGGIRHRREATTQNEVPVEPANKESDSEPSASGAAGIISVPAASILSVPTLGVQQSVWGPSSLAGRAWAMPTYAPAWGPSSKAWGSSNAWVASAPAWGPSQTWAAPSIVSTGVIGAKGWGINSLERGWARPWGASVGSWGHGVVSAAPVAVGVKPMAVAVPISVPVVQSVGIASPSVWGASSPLINSGKWH